MAPANEFSRRQAGNHLEHTLLLPPLEIGLEPHQIPEPAVLVFLAQLHHGVGPLGPTHIAVFDISPAGIPETNGFQRPVAHRVFTTPRKFLNRQTALEEGGVFLVEIL